MKITIDALKNKIRDNYGVVGADGEITGGFSNYDNVDVIYVDKKTVRVEYTSNGRRCGMVVHPVALLHRTRNPIAIDEVKESNPTKSYKKYRIVCCDGYNYPSSVISTYVFYKLISAFGTDKVSLEALDYNGWRRANYSESYIKDTSGKDTYTIVIGNDNTRYFGTLEGDLAVGVTRRKAVDNAVKKVIKTLGKLGVEPCIDLETDSDRIIKLANGIYGRDNSLEHYVFKLMTEIKPDELDKLVKSDASLFRIFASVHNYFKVDDTSVDVFNTYRYTDAAETDIAKLCKDNNITLWEYICAKYILSPVYAEDEDGESTDEIIYLKSLWSPQSSIGSSAYKVHMDACVGSRAIEEYQGKNIAYIDAPRAWIYTFDDSRESLAETVDDLTFAEGIKSFTIEEAKDGCANIGR